MVGSGSFREAFALIAKDAKCCDTKLDIEMVGGNTVIVEKIEAEFKK